jgi:hypothetical protein
VSDWIASKTGSELANTAGEPIYAEELNPENLDDAQWLGAADNGRFLVIGGDNLVITETRLDVDAAGRLGTLVIDFVPMQP